MRYRAIRTRFKWNPKSKLNSLVKISKTALPDQRAYQNSLPDQMTPRSVLQPLNGLDLMKPALSVAVSDHPIISKNQSRSNRGPQGCHITSRDVTFNAEILHHGRDIISAQFEQDQPPEYALIWAPQVFIICLKWKTSLSHFFLFSLSFFLLSLIIFALSQPFAVALVTHSLFLTLSVSLSLSFSRSLSLSLPLSLSLFLSLFPSLHHK
jgi:hypothetical protein